MTHSAGSVARLAAVDIDFAYSNRDGGLVNKWCAEFHPGSVTAITGPSGCGKSTRMYLLSLMLKIRGGAILLDGCRVDNLSDARRSAIRAQRFGFVFQDAALDSTRSVIDNITETALYRGDSRRPAHRRGVALMEQFGILVPPERRPGQISGGQAQRIALCRALLGSPDVILADEPTGNLDPASATAVLEALRARADEGGCVIVVTHDAAIAGWADENLTLTAESS